LAILEVALGDAPNAEPIQSSGLNVAHVVARSKTGYLRVNQTLMGYTLWGTVSRQIVMKSSVS